MEIILASASPRRKELLSKIFSDFKVIPSDAEDKAQVTLQPIEKVEYLAKIKARDIKSKYNNALVIGSDTIVVVDNKLLEKPKDKQDAVNMISNLSGRSHSVFTAVCICYNGEETSFVEETKVTFNNMTDKEIDDYTNTSEPYDKAGAYGIQGVASKYISKIEGDYFNVCGLPVSKLYYTLKKILGENL